MTPQVQHLIETRFSVPMGQRSAFQSRAWLLERIELMRRFCLPSLAAQTSRDFTWLLFCDESTDAGVIDELRAHERDLPFLRIELTGTERTMPAAVRSVVEPDTDVLITTRLDSDDAIADRYVESVQAYADRFHRSAVPRVLVNFPRGYRLDARNGTLYHGYMQNSMFHSLLEKPQKSPAKTVLGVGHTDLHQHYPAHQDESHPAWLIVVHGGNLTNKVVLQARQAPFDGTVPGFTLDAP